MRRLVCSDHCEPQLWEFCFDFDQVWRVGRGSSARAGCFVKFDQELPDWSRRWWYCPAQASRDLVGRSCPALEHRRMRQMSLWLKFQRLFSLTASCACALSLSRSAARTAARSSAAAVTVKASSACSTRNCPSTQQSSLERPLLLDLQCS